MINGPVYIWHQSLMSACPNFLVRLEIVLDQKLELSSWEEGIIKAKQLILFELAILNFARLLVITEINSVH